MSVPLDQSIPWDEGRYHHAGWILLLTSINIGLFLNVLQIIFYICIPKLRELPNAQIILSLAIQDGLLDFLCVAPCAISLHFDELFGKEVLCFIEGVYGLFLMVLSGLTVCCLNYSSYINIVKGRCLTLKEFGKIQGGLIIYATILTVLGVIYPGKAVLNSSGTFCYIATEKLTEGIIFYIGFTMPLFVGLIVMNWKLESGLKKMRETLLEYGLEANPRPAQVNTLKSMRLYVMAMLACYCPVIILSIYSWASKVYPPAILWDIFGFVGHGTTIVNPVIYYILSMPARRAVLGYVWPSANHESLSVPNSESFDLILNSTVGQAALRKEAEKTYCPELTKFLFDDYPAWIAATQHRTKELQDNIESQEKPALLEIDKMATFLCRTYIDDDAPLLLNLSADLRKRILARVRNGPSNDPNPETIFDEARLVIRELVATNLFKGASCDLAAQELIAAHERIMESAKGPFGGGLGVEMHQL